MVGRGTARLLQELSNFYCHPRRAGGTPMDIRESRYAFAATDERDSTTSLGAATLGSTNRWTALFHICSILSAFA